MSEKKFPEKITYKELAKIANVGIGTLSRYFNSGYVSNKSKNQIKQAIEKTNFIRHGGAALLNLKNNYLTIIIRTLIRSDAQDEIVQGIITKTGVNTIIKYSLHDEDSMIQTILRALEFRPRNLIVFAPLNASDKFAMFLKQFSTRSKIVVYNYKSDFASSVSLNVEQALSKMSLKYDNVSFIYNNIQDKHSYQDRLQTLQQNFKRVMAYPELKKVKNIDDELVVFQTSNLYKNELSLNNEKLFNLKSLLIASEKMHGVLKPKHFIFVDYFAVGLNLGHLCSKPEVINLEVVGKQIY